MRLGQTCQWQQQNDLLRWHDAEVTISNAVTWYGPHVHHLLSRLMERGISRWFEPVINTATEFVVTNSREPWFDNIENTDGDVVLRSEFMDGPGGVLGYVPLPVEGNVVNACEGCGSVYMDQWESWTARMWFGFWLHEFGHTMGLAHSPRRDSIMYPQYQGQLELGPTDVASVVALYEQVGQ